MAILNNVFLTKKEIDVSVKKLAKDIVRHYRKERKKEIVIILVWNGAFMFGTDLIRQIREIKNEDVELFITGITVKRYGDQINGKEEIYIEPMALSEIKEKYKGYPKLIVDEISDEGKTIEALTNAIDDPNNIENCILLVKSEKIQINTPRFIGFKVADVFFRGYGMGCGDRFRDSSHISIVDQ